MKQQKSWKAYYGIGILLNEIEMENFVDTYSFRNEEMEDRFRDPMDFSDPDDRKPTDFLDSDIVEDAYEYICDKEDILEVQAEYCQNFCFYPVNTSEGHCKIDISKTKYYILQANSTDQFISKRYSSIDEIVNEFQNRYSKMLKNFDFLNHLGYFDYACCY